MEKCPFCGAGIYDELYFKVFDCMSYVKDGKLWRMGPCYERQLAQQAELLRKVRVLFQRFVNQPHLGTFEVVRDIKTLIPALEKAREKAK